MKTSLSTVIMAVALATTALVAPASAEDAVSLPNLSYRTGPFAATGTPLMNGQRDYMMMLNERDGGSNGVKLGYDECETGYNTEKGVECYEKTKAAGGIVTQPWSTGITLQVLPRSNVDKIPILAPGYGFSAMQDGKTFQWAFNPPSSYWDGAAMILSNISGGNPDSLKGKKVVLLHLDAPASITETHFGRILALLCADPPCHSAWMGTGLGSKSSRMVSTCPVSSRCRICHIGE